MDRDENAKRHLLALWEAKRGMRLMPGRSDFDVIADLRPFLGDLMLIEVVEGGLDYRFRVFGCTITALIDEEHQNKRLSEISADDAQTLRAMFGQVVRSRTPADYEHSGFRSRRIAPLQALLLPLSEDGAQVDMILYLLEHPGLSR